MVCLEIIAPLSLQLFQDQILTRLLKLRPCSWLKSKGLSSMNKMRPIWFKHIWLKQLSQVRKDLVMISNFSHLEVVVVEVEEDEEEDLEEVDQELELADLNAKCVENLVMWLGIAITDSIKIGQILSNLRLSKILLHLLLAFTIQVLICLLRFCCLYCISC